MGSPLIHLIDDDPCFLAATDRMLRSAGHHCLRHPNARSFLANHNPSIPGCVVLDLELPDMNGLKVQHAVDGTHPVVFLAGTRDIAVAVRAIKSGAIDFLTKPCVSSDLLAAVEEALAADAALRAERARRQKSAGLVARLTTRERQVLDQIVLGKLNKQIAAEIGASEKTVKVHRFRLMRKLEARSVPDLIRTLRDAVGGGR